MIKYYLNGVECNPANKDAVEYTFDFTDRRARELELSVDSLRFVKQDKTAIEDWINNYGYFVGMPLDIKYSNGTVIRYILDFQDGTFTKSTRAITVKPKRYKAMDNFFDNADGLSFGSCSWQESDFVKVDYVVIPPDQITYFITLALGTFSFAQELVRAVKELIETITELIKAIVPVGVPIPGPDWGAIIILVIKVLARIAYIILIIVALTKLITEMVNLIFPKVRQFKAVQVKKLIQKGCEKLGYTLSSTLLDNLAPLTICPVPLKEKKPSLWKQIVAPMSLAYTRGYPSSRDSIWLLGQAITEVENIFNAKTIVVDGVVRIETEAWYEANASGIILEAFTDQSALSSDNRLNTDEISKRLVMSYAVDPTDVNTFDDTERTLYEVSSEVVNAPAPNLELIKGVDVVNISLARGSIKGDLTIFEKALKELAGTIDNFTGGNAAAKIEGRKYSMQISSQYFSQTKLLWMNGTKLHSNQNQFIGCDVLVNTYYSSRFIENNQKDVYEAMPVALTESEIFNILSNNFVNLNNGKVMKITRVNWSEVRNLALIDFEVRRASVNEKTEIINNGL